MTKGRVSSLFLLVMFVAFTVCFGLMEYTNGYGVVGGVMIGTAYWMSYLCGMISGRAIEQEVKENEVVP